MLRSLCLIYCCEFEILRKKVLKFHKHTSAKFNRHFFHMEVKCIFFSKAEFAIAHRIFCAFRHFISNICVCVRMCVDATLKREMRKKFDDGGLKISLPSSSLELWSDGKSFSDSFSCTQSQIHERMLHRARIHSQESLKTTQLFLF